MKSRLFFSLLGILLFHSLAFGQNKLQGLVNDSENEGIFFATVVLYSVPDNRIVNSTSSNAEGLFVLENIEAGDYVLKARMLGYQESVINDLRFPRDHNRDVTFTLEEDVKIVAEVEVVGKKTLLEQRSDRLVVNVENTLIGTQGSMKDALKLVPGIIVSQNRIGMAGQNNLTILIDGKSTQYMDIQSLLAVMPAGDIKKIEVIHQPGAEFEASGTGPMVNIVLKNNKLLGTNGSVSVGATKDYKWIPRSSLSLSHYKGDVNMSGFLAYFPGASKEQLDITRRIGDDVYTQSSNDPNDAQTMGANFSVDWELAKNQKLGLASQFWGGTRNKVQTSSTQIDYKNPDEEDISLFTRNTNDGFWNFASVNPYYSIHFNQPDHKLDIDLNYFELNNGSENELATENIFQPDSFFPGQRFDQPGNTRIGALKVDYNMPVSASVKLDLGVKYSMAKLDNDLSVFQEISMGEWEKDLSSSNHFVFDESLGAVYAKLNYNREKWSGTLGLRFEESNSEGRSLTIDESIDRKISKLFPSFSLRRDLGGPLAAAVAYSYRIERPGYFDLNPFTTSLDPYTSIKGNPTLVPALTHSLRFNLIFENQPFFNLEYKTIQDPMVEVTQQNDETGETFLNTVNLEKQQLFNAEFLFPLDFIPAVSGYGGITANYNKYDSEYLEADFQRDRWTYGAFIQSDISLPFKLKGELGGSYFSGVLNGIMSLEHFYSVQVGLGRSFMDNKAQVSIGVDDLFYRYRHGEIKYGNMDIEFVEQWFAPKWKLNIKYRFGNRFLKRKANRKMGAQEEIDRTRN